LLHVQVINNRAYIKLADSQHQLKLTLYPQRGLIYDRSMKVFALSLKVFSVYAVPRQLDEENKEHIAAKLSEVLGLDYNELFQKLQRDKLFVWIKRRIDEETAQQVRQLGLNGVGLLKESKRHYPNGGLAAHVIGFAGIDECGLEGIERQYNRYLKGQTGHRYLLRDAKQRMLPAFEYEVVPAVDGYNLVLTIDEIIQHIVEEELDNAFGENNAVGASVVVMNPDNGEIYALANRPGYDLNEFKDSTSEQRRNRAICDYFEPGSTFKIITASTALEAKKVTLDEVFYCEEGEYRVSRHILHDHRPHGDLTFVEVIEKSSNIGVVKVAQKLGEKLLYEYVRRYAFGEKTGIDLPGETSGFFRPLERWSKLSISAVPIGHEIGVSVIQMVRAMAVIANGGYLVRPHIVQKVVDNNGQVIKGYQAPVPRRVISTQTSQTMRQILKGVVDNGTGRRAKIAGYEVGGKTGTAQKIDAEGRYSHNKFIASFIGFAPVEKPLFVIAVVFDEPRPYYYGGLVSAPVFKNIAEKILRYLNVAKKAEGKN